MKVSIRTTSRAVLSAVVSAVFASTALAASTKTPPSAPKQSIKQTTKTTDPKKTQSVSGSQALTTADSTIYPALPGMSTVSPDQAHRAVAAAEAGHQALSEGDLGTAEADFRSSTNLDHGASNVSAVVGLAQTLEREGKSRQAIKVYRYLLYPKQGWGTSWEDDPILRMHFALLLAGDGQWAEAVSLYENTIGHVSYGSSFPALNVHFSPDAPQPALFQAMAHLAMGITYRGRLEDAKALAEYAAAVSAQPDLALAHYYYGLDLLRLGHRAGAKAAFQQATALGEGDVKKAAEHILTDLK